MTNVAAFLDYLKENFHISLDSYVSRYPEVNIFGQQIAKLIGVTKIQTAYSYTDRIGGNVDFPIPIEKGVKSTSKHLVRLLL